MRSRRNRRGVTWVELVLALGVAGAVVGGIVVYQQPKSGARDVDVAVKDAQRIHDAVVDWRADNPSGCPTLSRLQQDRKLALDARTDDPWGQRFRVDCSGDTIRVISPGRDGKANTRDDVSVPRS
jgi:general secretion pathway protein G